MKKFLSIILVLILIFSVIPSVFATETDITPEEKEFIKNNWKNYANIKKSGDWYYISSGIVCGYDGDETDVTIPVNINGSKIVSVTYFILFSDTVKTLRIPKEIKIINPSTQAEVPNHNYSYISYSDTTSLSEIIVEDGNEDYLSIDGVLMCNDNYYSSSVLLSKDNTSIIQYPPAREDQSYTIPKEVKTIRATAFRGIENLKSITVTENVTSIMSGAFPKSLESLYFKNGVLAEGVMTKSSSSIYEKNYGYNKTLPKLPNTTVYCAEGSPLYDYYKKMTPATDYYKELKLIPKAKAPSKPTIKSISYSNSEKAMKITLKKQECTGFKIYRTYHKSNDFEYVGFTTSDTFYDEGAKKCENYLYKALAYVIENDVMSEGKMSDSKASPKKSYKQNTTVSEPSTNSNLEASSESTDITFEESEIEPQKAESKTEKEKTDYAWVWIVLAAVLAIGGGTAVFFLIKRKS